MAEVRLYDANGGDTGQVATTDQDEDPSRDGVLEQGGTTYIWHQRYGQWRAASGVVKLKTNSTKPEEPRSSTVPDKPRAE